VVDHACHHRRHVTDDAVSRRALLRLQIPALRPSAPGPDAGQIKERIAARWSAGAEALQRAWEPLAADVCDAAGIKTGMAVLDAACGDGNVALEAARRGAMVSAYDLSPAQLERGRERAAAERLDAKWVEADVEALPGFDGSFDAVLSVYGAALAPRPKRTVRELLRLTRRGGVLVFAAPAAYSLFDAALELAQSGRGRLPQRVPSPGEWGRQEVARERILAVAPDTDVEARVVSLALEFPGEAQAWEAFAGPFGLPESVRERFADEIVIRSESTDSVRITEWVTLIVARRPD
jgi:SAM-dependent methyltransferase